MTVLGVALDPTASTEAMVTHRTRKAEAAFSRHGPALRDAALPAAQGWALWHDTVGASLLSGCVVWRLSSALQQGLAAVEARAGRRLLGHRRRPTEDWIQVIRRCDVQPMQHAAGRDTVLI